MNSAIDVGYEYVNARLRAMRSRLLEPAALEQLLAAPNLEALIGQLDQSVYHDALEQALSTSSGLSAVLRAVRLHHGQVMRRIAAFGGDTIAPVLAILLAPYHRATVVALLRGISTRQAPDRILAWVYDVPPLTESLLSELARQDTVRELTDLLAQWKLLSPELAASLVAVRSSDFEQREFSTAFDVAWAQSTTRQAAALAVPGADLVRLDLARFIDLHNLLHALNLRQLELAHTPSWLPGGYLAPEVLETVRTASEIQVMDGALAAARGGEFWRRALEKWDGDRSTDLQRLWESTLLRWRVSLFASADPLGPGVLIAFVAALGAEARDLRSIAEAVAGNIDRDDARAQFLSQE